MDFKFASQSLSFPLLLISASTDKETSTSCTKWCNTEPTCASRTCRAKRPCIMQWLGETCKWRRNSRTLKQQRSLFGTEASALTWCSFPSVAVHYLWETGMFRFTDTDKYQVTPLHLAASTGNTEVVRYLLRNQVGYSQTGLHSLNLSTLET